MRVVTFCRETSGGWFQCDMSHFERRLLEVVDARILDAQLSGQTSVWPALTQTEVNQLFTAGLTLVCSVVGYKLITKALGL